MNRKGRSLPLPTSPIPKVVAARRFVLLGPEGRLRAQFGATADGGAGLALYDRAGRPWACLTVEADCGVRLGLYGRGDPIPEAVGVEDGVLRLRFADPGVAAHTVLELDPMGPAVVVLVDQEGKVGELLE